MRGLSEKRAPVNAPDEVVQRYEPLIELEAFAELISEGVDEAIGFSKGDLVRGVGQEERKVGGVRLDSFPEQRELPGFEFGGDVAGGESYRARGVADVKSRLRLGASAVDVS